MRKAALRRLIALALSGTAVLWIAGQSELAGQTTPRIKRTADGHPDLSGFWQIMNTADTNIEAHSASENGPAGLGVVEGGALPYKPEAFAKREKNFSERATADTTAHCFLPGIPRIMYTPYPFQIVQTPTQMTMLFEYAHATRNIYTNGSPHIPGPLEWWMGDARGHWEGDTLVVDVNGFNDSTWFDHAGNYHSTALHLVERFTPLGPDHMNYEVTVEDPQVFTRPWKMSMPIYRHKEQNFQLLDYECYAFEWEHNYHFKKPTS